MSNNFKWLDSSFDQTDERAPIRAFLLGAGITFVVAIVCCLAVAPTDYKMLAGFGIGFPLIGGGCCAMFALPPERLVSHCWLSLRLCSYIPLKFLMGLGPVTYAFMEFALFVGILAILTSFRVLFQIVFGSHISRQDRSGLLCQDLLDEP